MTVDISNVAVVYTVTRNASSEVYTIPFPYIEREYVKCYWSYNDVRTDLTYGSGYTVRDKELTIGRALPVGAKVVIQRITDPTQEIHWTEGQAIYSPDIEQADDKLTHSIQELWEQVNRAIKVTSEDDAAGVTPDDLGRDLRAAKDDAEKAARESEEARDISVTAKNTALEARDVTIATKDAALRDIARDKQDAHEAIVTDRDNALVAMQNARTSHLATLQAETNHGLSEISKTVASGKSSVALEADKAIALVGQVGAISKLAIGEENVEAVFRTRERIRSGDTVNLGSFAYFVGRNTLRLNWEGVELFRGISYDEIGEDGKTSSQVKIYKDIPENQLIRAWNVSSNLSLRAEEVKANTEEVRRNTQITTNAASEAESSAQRAEDAANDSEEAAKIARDYRMEIMMAACMQNKGRLNMVGSLEDYAVSPNGWYVIDDEEEIPTLCAQPLLSFNQQPDAPDYADFFYVLAGEMDCNHPDDIVIPSRPDSPSGPSNPNNPTPPPSNYGVCGGRYGISYRI